MRENFKMFLTSFQMQKLFLWWKILVLLLRHDYEEPEVRDPRTASIVRSELVPEFHNFGGPVLGSVRSLNQDRTTRSETNRFWSVDPWPWWWAQPTHLFGTSPKSIHLLPAAVGWNGHVPSSSTPSGLFWESKKCFVTGSLIHGYCLV